MPTVLYDFVYPYPVAITNLPIGMAYVAAALRRAGHEVYSVNCNNRFEFGSAKEMLSTLVKDAISESKPDAILTGGLCTDFACLREIVKLCRRFVPDQPVIVGGGIVTHDPDFTTYALGADFGIVGEAEQTICNFLDRTDEETNIVRWGKPPAKLSYDCPPIESLPYPDYSIFGGWNEIEKWAPAIRYNYRFQIRGPVRPLAIVAGRSCVFNCTFCIQNRTKYRTRSTADLIKELLHVKRQYDFNMVTFQDELFTVKPDHLREFSQAILDSGLRFTWNFQTHASARFDVETLKLAKRAGLYYFTYGLESAAPAVLKSMGKHTMPEMVADGIVKANEVGIGFGANVIFGDPAERGQTIRQTMQFVRKNCEGVHLWLSSVNPYPGSKLNSLCLQSGLISDKLFYYETIDKRRYNMTRFPSILFKPWVALVGWMAGYGLYMRPASGEAVGSFKEADDQLETTVYRARCPYCGTEISHYEPCVATRERDEKIMGIANNRFSSWMIAVKEAQWFLWFVMALAFCMSLFVPWWGTLRHLKHKGFIRIHGYRTGCHACNRAFRITTKAAQVAWRWRKPTTAKNATVPVANGAAGDPPTGSSLCLPHETKPR